MKQNKQNKRNGTSRAKSTSEMARTTPKMYAELGCGFPEKLRMTHKYSSSLQMSPAGTNPTWYAFSCNNMYDPETSLIGHQPYYYDKMTALYDHWTVTASRISVFITRTTSTTTGWEAALTIDDDASPVVVKPYLMAETPYGQYQMAGIGGTSAVHFQSFWNGKQFFGDAFGVGNPQFQGAISTPPNEQSFWIVSTQAVDGVSSLDAYIRISIEYDATWSELKEVPTS